MTDDIKMKAVNLGIDAEVFKRSAFGKYLVEQAHREIEAETQILVDLEPTDIEGNTESRMKINTAKMFLVWLEQAISSGQLATEQFKLEDGDDTPD